MTAGEEEVLLGGAGSVVGATAAAVLASTTTGAVAVLLCATSVTGSTPAKTGSSSKRTGTVKDAEQALHSKGGLGTLHIQACAGAFLKEAWIARAAGAGTKLVVACARSEAWPFSTRVPDPEELTQSALNCTVTLAQPPTVEGGQRTKAGGAEAKNV